MGTPPIEAVALLTPPEILGCKRVLCIQPHPDDNEIGMGGIIARLAAASCEVHYLTITNGNQGNRDRRAAAEETAAQRRKETKAAGQYLGAKKFHFLDHDDGSLDDVLGLSAEIAAVIRRVRPEAVFCPDPWLPYEAHWDHVVTGRAAANAFLMSGRVRLPGGENTEPWNAQAIGYYFSAQPNTVIDISAWFDKKMEAVALHDSQIDEQTLGMYRIYFQMKGAELAGNRGFALGEGLKVLSPLHSHCFVDAVRI
ncbi:MAG: PIG-L family deacetylase [Treponema sp.]|jgi:LmbE family N-acetylglucosaminyl deacetylase|nr:PIG-L family deacetylase [Treponema sp.]